MESESSEFFCECEFLAHADLQMSIPLVMKMRG